MNNYYKIIIVSGTQVAMSKGNQIDTISTWGKYFTVEADITVNKYPSGRNKWVNVFHFTTGKYKKIFEIL